MEQTQHTSLILDGIILHAKIGVTSAEQTRARRLLLSVKLVCDLRQACKTDDVTDTIDYALLTESLRDLAASRSWNLLESLAHSLAERCLQNELAERVRVQLTKPRPCPNLTNASVRVELTRPQA